MVKVNGPMFSLAASGTLADTITFAVNKGRAYVRERVIPSNPKSGAQTGRRAMMAFLSQNWAALSPSEKATWQTLADASVISPFNAYTQHNLKRWHNFSAPGVSDPIGESVNGSDNVLTAAVWEENRVKITAAGSALADTWGLITYASLVNGFTPAVGNAVIVALDTTIASHNWFWTPPTVDTWYFNSMTFSEDGLIMAAGGEVNAVP